jgi:hypothetical protein
MPVRRMWKPITRISMLRDVHSLQCVHFENNSFDFVISFLAPRPGRILCVRSQLSDGRSMKFKCWTKYIIMWELFQPTFIKIAGLRDYSAMWCLPFSFLTSWQILVWTLCHWRALQDHTFDFYINNIIADARTCEVGETLVTLNRGLWWYVVDLLEIRSA